MATAFAAAQARRQVHLRYQPALALPRGTLAFRTGRRGNSSFPPTTCLQLRLRSPTSARDQSSPGVLSRSSLHVSALPAARCRLFGPRSFGGSRSHASSTHVEGEVVAPEERKAFSNDFQSPSVRGGVREVEVQVAQETVRGNPCSTSRQTSATAFSTSNPPAAQE